MTDPVTPTDPPAAPDILDPGDETPTAAPLSLDLEWDAAPPTVGQPDPWLDLPPGPDPIAPDPHWPLGPGSSAAPAPSATSTPSAVPAPGVTPLGSSVSSAPTFEIYHPPSDPSPASRPYVAPVVRQQPAVPADSTAWASAAHWSGLVASVATSGLGFLGPLIVNLVRGKTDPFVRAHAIEALNFQLTILICVAASVVALLFVVGIAGLVAFPVLDIVCSIMGAVVASRGQGYRYPINFRMVK